MNIDVVISQQDIEYFILILVRITSFVFLAPFFGMTNTPTQTKLGLSVFLTLIMYSILPEMTVEYTSLLEYSAIVVKEAAAGLRAVIQHYRNSDQKIFYKYIADTLEEYFDEIANSFIVVEKYSKNGKYAARLSNGPMESLNRIPKDLKRNARGYRNFEHIRQRFLFSQRSSAAVRANPKPLEEVLLKSNIKRGPYVKKAYRADCIDKFF